MKKLFNNSTKGNDTQNQASKSKRKFLKTFSFTSLALLMGAAGVFAFAPLGATNPQLANANEMVDQINTKADGGNIKYAPSPLGLDPENDPVIYTTESGLEIKYGGASLTANGGGNESVSDITLETGKPLSGYPYFTMGTYNNYPVNWIIIGKSTSGDFPSFINLEYLKLASLQTIKTQTPTYNYFFNNTYEETTPAGTAIKSSGLLNNYTARKTSYTFSTTILNSIISNAEIPSGCFLAISECTLGTSTYGNTHIYGNLTSGIKIAMENLYNSGLGLTTAQKNIIQSVDMYIKYYNWNTNHLVTGQKLFAMPWYGSSTGKTENFGSSIYFSSNALRVAYAIGTTTATAYWNSSGEAWSSNCNTTNLVYTKTDGVGACASRTNTFGVRPTGVFKF